MQTFHRPRYPVAAFALALICLFTQGQAFARSQEANFIRVNTDTESNKPSAVRGDLLLANDGNIYFTSSTGGANGVAYGSIVKLAPDGTLTTVWTFPNEVETPVQPFAGLIQGTDGNLYGTTFLGGFKGGGTVYRLSLSGVFTLLHSFGDGTTDGSLVYTGVVQAPDGYLYGTTMGGGTNGKGTIFRMAVDGGNFSYIHQFNGTDGDHPEGTLIVGSDGNLYGTTLQGGSGDRGTVYRISPSGTFTSLYSFASLSAFNTLGIAVNATGANPRAGLMQAKDGDYYGTTYQGGTGGYGTVFRITADGTLSVVRAFEGAPYDGGFPLAGVTQDAAGNFYGTTLRGGHLDLGSAWRISSSGKFSMLHGFIDAGTDGSGPYAKLLLANGTIYGASFTDSLLTQGTLFKLDLGTNGVLPIEISVSPTDIILGSNATLTWSSPSATKCITTGTWSNSDAISGTLQVAPVLPGNYIYGLSCTDGTVMRHAFAALAIRTPAFDTVDGGGGAGSLSVPLLLLLAVLLFRKKPREISTACP